MRDRLLHGSILLVLLLGVGITYAASVQGAFQFDDSLNIVGNPNLGSGLIHRIVVLDKARPLLMLSFYWSYRWGGDPNPGGPSDPAMFHKMNIAIHLLAMALVYGIVLQAVRLLKGDGDSARAFWPIPTLTALIFGLHPLQTQAVTYISSRSTSLCTLLMLGCLYCFIRFRLRATGLESGRAGVIWRLLPVVTFLGILGALLVVFHTNQDPKNHFLTAMARAYVPAVFEWFDEDTGTSGLLKARLDVLWLAGWALVLLFAGTWILAWFWWKEKSARAVATLASHSWLLASTILFLLAMGVKELSIVTPLLIIAFDRILIQRSRPLRVRTALWGYLPMLLLAVAAVVARQAILRGEVPEELYSTTAYWKTQGVVLWKYVALFLAPLGLSLDHTVSTPTPWQPSTTAWMVGYLALGIALIVACVRARRWPVISLCIFWFLIGSAPTSWFKALSDPMFEHRVYLVMPALAALFSLAFVYAFRLIVDGRPAYFLRVAGFSVAAAILLCLAALTQTHNALYNTEAQAWQNVLKNNPTSPRALNAFGQALLRASAEQMNRRQPENILSLWVDPQISDVARQPDRKKIDLMIRFVDDGLDHAEALLKAAYALETERDAVARYCHNLAVTYRHKSELLLFKLQRPYQYSGKAPTAKQQEEVKKQLSDDAYVSTRVAHGYWQRGIGLRSFGVHVESAVTMGLFFFQKGLELYTSIEGDLGPDMSAEAQGIAERARNNFWIAVGLELESQGYGLKLRRTLHSTLAGAYYYLGKLELGRKTVTGFERTNAYDLLHAALEKYGVYFPLDTLTQDRPRVVDTVKNLRILEQQGVGSRRMRIPRWGAADSLPAFKPGNGGNIPGPSPPRASTSPRPLADSVDRAQFRRALQVFEKLGLRLKKIAATQPGASTEPWDVIVPALASDKPILEAVANGQAVDGVHPDLLLGRFNYLLAVAYLSLPDSSRRVPDAFLGYDLLHASLTAYANVELSEVDKLQTVQREQEVKRVHEMQKRIARLERDFANEGLRPRSVILPTWAR